MNTPFDFDRFTQDADYRATFTLKFVDFNAHTKAYEIVGLGYIIGFNNDGTYTWIK